MSSIPNSATPPTWLQELKRGAERKAAKDARDAEGSRIGGLRDELWLSRIDKPLDEFTPRWRDAWQQFAELLRSGNPDEPSGAIIHIHELLIGLQHTWENAANSFSAWYCDHGVPFNNQFPDWGPFCRTWFQSYVPLAAKLWQSTADENSDLSPQCVAARFGVWPKGEIREHFRDSPRYRTAFQVSLLLKMLSEGCPVTPDHAKLFLSSWSHEDRVQMADVALIAAAIILPDPGFVPQFFSGNPSEATVDTADTILHWGGVVIGDDLRDFFRQWREGQARVRAHPTTADESAGPGTTQASPPANNEQPEALQPVETPPTNKPMTDGPNEMPKTPVVDLPTHAPDFAWVRCHHGPFTFTPKQRPMVAALWRDWETDGMGVSLASLLKTTGDKAKRVGDAFRGHPAWNTLIVDGERVGIKRLDLPRKPNH